MNKELNWYLWGCFVYFWRWNYIILGQNWVWDEKYVSCFYFSSLGLYIKGKMFPFPWNLGWNVRGSWENIQFNWNFWVFTVLIYFHIYRSVYEFDFLSVFFVCLARANQFSSLFVLHLPNFVYHRFPFMIKSLNKQMRTTWNEWRCKNKHPYHGGNRWWLFSDANYNAKIEKYWLR